MSESVNGVVVVHITEELFLSFPLLEWKLDSSKYAFTLFLCFYFILFYWQQLYYDPDGVNQYIIPQFRDVSSTQKKLIPHCVM